MENVTYIRHFFGKERITSDTADIFQPVPKTGASYQDVISFSSYEEDKYLVHTMGKHVFPENYDIVVSMQRWMIVFVVEGSLKCGMQQLNRGDFMVFPSSCTGNLCSKRDNPVFYWCTTNDDQLIKMLVQSGYSDNMLMLGRTENIELIIEQFEKSIYNFPKDCDSKMNFFGRLVCLFSYISTTAIKKRTVSDKIFKRCLDLIDGSLGNITVDYLAKHCFISRRYLYTMFIEYKGMSPMEYIISVRMQIADKYIRSTNYSIADIAERTGYSNYSHFTRAYRKYYSVSPSERRKQMTAQPFVDEERTEKDFDGVLFDE